MTEDAQLSQELWSVFLVESLEQLDRFSQALVLLEKDQDDNTVLNELFRIAHSLKGSSGTVGFNDIMDSMHAAEDLLDAARSGKHRISSDEFDLLLSLSDSVTDFLKNPGGSFCKGDWVDRLRAPLDTKSTEGSSLWDPTLVLGELEKHQISLLQEDGKGVYGAEVEFADDAAFRSATAFIFLSTIREFTDVLKTAPEIDDLIAENYSKFKVVFALNGDLGPDEERKINNIKLGKPEIISVGFRKWVYRPNEIKPEETKSFDRGDKAADTIRVDAEKLRVMLNTVGNLISIRHGLDEIISSGTVQGTGLRMLKMQLNQFHQTLAALQTEIMGLRMVPIRQLFDRYSRVLRDLAHKVNKDVELVVRGEGTEIDKKVMELLVDPLTHLVRNAVDHGIEDSNVRLAQSKSSKGHVTLSATREGSNIVIEISDDGAGINSEKVKAKAVAKGIASPDKTYTDREIYDFLFTPGFSTAEQITDISGRGVGLDVVKTNLSMINGTVTISSQMGIGTIFRLVVPLTLAIINAFLVRIAGEIFAIPCVDVLENTMVSFEDLHEIERRRFFRLRDEVIPLVDVGGCFYTSATTFKEKQPVVIAKVGNRKAALIVDGFLEPCEIMIRPFNPSLGQVSYVSGVTVLGNGRVAMVLDTASLLQSVQ